MNEAQFTTLLTKYRHPEATYMSIPAATVAIYAPLFARYIGDKPLEQVCRFLANVFNETGMLKALRENLNYSAEGILATFGHRFTPAEAQAYAHQPIRIANKAYANMIGNGNEQSGDGNKYRGGGCLQTTGRSNYSRLMDVTCIDFVNHPELIEVPENAVKSAREYWDSLHIDNAPNIMEARRLIAAPNSTGTPFGYVHVKNHYDALRTLIATV